MGVRGLTSFIDAHPELLTDFRLHDTKIVIDGNNLYHFLYYYFNVPCEYGGDYDQFARSCDAFFSALQSCNITPYVVFDGAYATDGSKFQTSLSRARERVHMSNIVAYGRHAKLLPVLTHGCFIHVLQRLGVEHVTCDFEADRQTAALARHWNCPVLTNDSDFLVYDIPAGVVLLDYLNLRWKVPRGHPTQRSKVACRYLEAQIFSCQRFMRFLHIDNHCFVVLLATLLGNDIVDRRNFDGFVSHVKLPKSRGHSSYARRKIAGLIAWLQSVSSMTEAIECIMVKLPQNCRKNTLCLIESSLEFYSELQSNLYQYFETGEKNCNVCEFGGCILPDWFLASICRGVVPTAMLNVLVSRRLLLLSQIEASSQASSYACSQQLRQIAYGIAVSAGNSPADGQSPCPVVCVSEYDRECKALKMCSVQPVAQLCGSPLPSLLEVGQIDGRYRFLLLLEALGVSVDFVFELLLPDAQFVVAVLRYWIQHANATISSLHVHALLLCWLKLGALDAFMQIAPQSKTVLEAVRQSAALKKTRMLSKLSCVSDLTVAEDRSDLFVSITESLAVGFDESCTDEADDVSVVEEIKLRICEIDKAKEKLIHFDATPHHNHTLAYDAAIVYAFAEFQTCLMSAGFIASLLGLTVPDPASLFSGTAVYNLVRELRSRTTPDMYITELLGGPSTMLHRCYFQLMSSVLTALPEGSLEVVGCRPKTGKRSRKRRAHIQESSEPETLFPDAEPSSECCSVNCDVDNRFSNLSLLEE